MFTRCPACRTVFHITAAELRSAEGTVVCGACDTTFDALESLSETRPAETGVAPPDAASPVEEDADAETDGEAGEEEEVLEERDEDEFLEEIESLIGADDLPETPQGNEDQPPAADAGASPTASPAPEASADDDLDGAIPDADSVFRVDEPADDFDAPSTAPFVGDEDEEPQSSGDGSSGDLPMSDLGDEERESQGSRTNRTEPQLEEQEEAAAENAENLLGLVRERPGGNMRLRIVMALVAVLVLAGTWAHVQRGRLLRLPAGEAVLGPIYSMLGMNVTPDWRPADYSVVRSEAIANADEPDTLRVAVEYLNSATFPQPHPVIRIVLLDRFGQRLGQHDVQPAQYLDGFASGDRAPAGGRIRASVTVPDPGARADGFRVDLCLDVGARGLVCAAEPFRQ